MVRRSDGQAVREGLVVVHADEACLGNGREGASPGGAGGLVETVRRSDGRVVRRDYFLSDPDTTNNRMAIRSATVALELLGVRRGGLRIEFVSDSEYLVNGMTQWMRGWKRRDWKNVKNPELWQELEALARAHDVRWRWVRGHAAHPRNEYADFLATRAAAEQRSSEGLVESGFPAWLAAQQEKGKYAECDPDQITPA